MKNYELPKDDYNEHTNFLAGIDDDELMFDEYDEEYDDECSDDDWEERREEERMEKAAYCTCGAWSQLKSGEVVHVADCCCGAD